jgi:hypothetical protein
MRIFLGRDADRGIISGAHRNKRFSPPDARSGRPSANPTIEVSDTRSGVIPNPGKQHLYGYRGTESDRGTKPTIHPAFLCLTLFLCTINLFRPRIRMTSGYTEGAEISLRALHVSA